MLGRVLLAAAAGMLIWKYRDPLRQYAKGNEGPARQKLDEVLRTVQERSEALLDRTKEQISTRLDTARDRVRGGAFDTSRENIPGSSFRA
jgi:hypothetical protein